MGSIADNYPSMIAIKVDFPFDNFVFIIRLAITISYLWKL